MIGDIGKLSSAVLFEDSQYYSFGENIDDWEVALPLTEKEIEEDTWKPVMNYLWPITGLDYRIDSEEEIKDILAIPGVMTMVYIESLDESYLALTAGGMDYSWQIAETYIRLGFLPPIAMGQLPSMAGEDYSTGENQEILRIMVFAYYQAIAILEGRIDTLKSMFSEAFTDEGENDGTIG